MKRPDTCEIPKRRDPGRTCGNTGRNPTQGIRVCKTHLRQRQTATPAEAWLLTQSIACRRHPRGRLERRGGRMVCNARVSGGGINPNVRN